MATPDDATATTGPPDAGEASDPVALALAQGKTTAEVAKAFGVTRRSVQRWLAHPPFAARVRQLRAEMIQAAAGVLADAMTEAASALRTLVADPAPEMRFKASAKLIELGLKVREATDTDERLRAVEESLRGAQGQQDHHHVHDPRAAGPGGAGGGAPDGGPNGAAGGVPGGPAPADA